jgi:hypothetical protein
LLLCHQDLISSDVKQQPTWLFDQIVGVEPISMATFST